MASRKPPKRLFKNKDVVHSYQHDRESKLGMKQMSRDHLDVPQNIEFTLVTCAREDPSIDDSIVDRAIRIALRRTDEGEDEDPRVIEVLEALDHMREFRQDVPDNIWQAGLKTVDESVRRHSDLKPGKKAYLKFVEPYVR